MDGGEGEGRGRGSGGRNDNSNFKTRLLSEIRTWLIISETGATTEARV